MGWPETPRRDICSINNLAKTANLRDLLIAIFPINVSLQMDDSFLWFSDPIEPELGPAPDSAETPQTYELRNRNESQWEAGLSFIGEKTGYELRAGQKKRWKSYAMATMSPWPRLRATGRH
jgi:hypothetical protein